MRRRRIRVRSAFSLLEVVLALTILFFALAALGELMRLALDNAARSRDLTQAQLRADSLLSEVAAGIRPVESTKGQFEDDPTWAYEITTSTLDQPGLLAVEVDVFQEGQGRTTRFSIVRWIRDPEVYPDAAAVLPESSGAASSGSTSSGSASGSAATQGTGR